jgi:nitrite reductase/ring-hydroxylating ferredoxin subunit
MRAQEPPMSAFTKVASLSDLTPGKSACVVFAGEKVALFNVRGTVYAIADSCTHRGGPLSEGSVDGTAVVCPWHGGRFELATGRATGPPAVRAVKRFPVSVQGNDILLGAAAEEAAP